MFIPLRTDREPKRRPVVTESLIVINLLVYLSGVMAQYAGLFDLETLIDAGRFVGHFGQNVPGRPDFHAWQLITYQFLHDPTSVMHIAGNMLFLWVFGCAVEDRMTRMGFLMFYLMAGIFAALAHAMSTDSPIIGASGSISGVTGAFLALFPRSRIRIFFFFFIIGIYSIPSLWFIGLHFLINILSAFTEVLGQSRSRVAFMAHIGGYVYGFLLAFALLATNVIKREEFDVFYLFRQSRRRAAFRGTQKQGRGAMWDKPHLDQKQPVPKAAKKPLVMSEDEQRHSAQRVEINRLLQEHRIAEAAANYRELLKEAPNTVFAESRQMDLANQFYSEGDHVHAAAAYELLLDCYRSGTRVAEVSLILGLIYARQLDRPKRARELIEIAKSKLRDASQTALADQLLSELTT